MKKVKPEFTQWRDVELSKRHRLYGFDVPALDIDHIVIEYDNAKPRAFIEYKTQNAAPVNPKHPSIRVLIYICDHIQIPLFVVYYALDFSSWTIWPVNTFSHRFFKTSARMDELQFVKFLWRLRGREMPIAIQQELLKHKPIQRGQKQQPPVDIQKGTASIDEW